MTTPRKSRQTIAKEQNDEIIRRAILALQQLPPTSKNQGLIRFLSGDIQSWNDFSASYVYNDCAEIIRKAYEIRKRRVRSKKSKEKGNCIKKDYSFFLDKPIFMRLQDEMVGDLFDKNLQFVPGRGKLQKMASFTRVLVDENIAKKEVGKRGLNAFFTKYYNVPKLNQINRSYPEHEEVFRELICRIKEQTNN